MKKISFKVKGKKISLEVQELGFFGRAFGLMFKSRENAKALLFNFEKPTRIGIHSFFVSFPFIAIWFDKKGKALEIKKIMPFTFFVAPRKDFYSLIEIPLNKKYIEKTKVLNSSSVIRNI